MTADSSRETARPRLWRPQRVTLFGAAARSRRLGLAGVAILALDTLFALAGHPVAGLAMLALLLAPGLALARLLPRAVRGEGLALAAAAPALGFAATSVVLITAMRVGIRLDGVSARLLLGAIVVVGVVALPLEDRVRPPAPVELALLAVALVAGVVLQARVLHGYPVPGNDWAKYLLYADEVRDQGRLLIDNPFWMLGVPFREDPGVPSVYGAFLTMTDAPVAVLAHGIWVFAVLGITTMFAYVRALWGPLAAGAAALLYAVLPINQDILGWHGLANVAALVLLPLVLLGATELLRGTLHRREAVGFALALVALAAAHRLSVTVTALTLALAGIVGLLVGPRRAILRGALWTALAVAAVGWGVISHLIEVNRTFGGTQGYQAYLNSKLDLDTVVLDLTWPFSIAAIAAALWGLWALRRRPELGVVLALLAVLVALTYSWLVHVPLSYLRMAYYLPVVLVPLVAVGLAGWHRPRYAWGGLGVAVILSGFVAAHAWSRAADVRTFYSFADAGSLRGLDAVEAQLRPGEVVVTDRCWSFLGTWLLHTRTLPALEPEDIQPKAELPIAREAASVLAGTPQGVALARRLGVRFLLVDPTCADSRGQPLAPPLVGEPVYVSRRLTVLKLPPDPRGSAARTR
jgi:hypothetical protein